MLICVDLIYIKYLNNFMQTYGTVAQFAYELNVQETLHSIERKATLICNVVLDDPPPDSGPPPTNLLFPQVLFKVLYSMF